MKFAEVERCRLAETLLSVGPDAPTLCEGWTTLDLAVHLYVRENRLDAAAGIFIPLFKDRLETVSREVASWGYESVVKKWAKGSRWPVPAQMNTAEHFVHHEDVLRAQEGWNGPRALNESEEKELYASLKMMAPMLLKDQPVPVVVEPTGFGRFVAADKHGVAENGSDVLRVSGPVGEIFMWAFGRNVYRGLIKSR
ncbi:TIGR03085 family metal-binding protein [Corynebacterium pyruviciproducens]|uniref:TIGR03085 family metal-binding protein n=1 Tax=Corynebacterium pyruviciproducens TaxID=598660 RepID=UPI0023F492B0|nr:TIGR03085 family metal-binding protein [Corynebacterium pyruviciproducens]